MRENQDNQFEDEYAEIVNALEMERSISGNEATFLRNLHAQAS